MQFKVRKSMGNKISRLEKSKLRSNTSTSNQKIGILGGSFDPLHLGHVHLVDEVQKHFSFDVLKLVPAFINPLKNDLPEASSQLRIKWLQEVFKDKSFITVDNQEIKNKKRSFTITTVNNIFRKFKIFF